MILLRIYYLEGWLAEWLVGCDVIIESISFVDALWLETLL